MINVNIRIEKIGRKWFQVIDLSDDSSAQLLIDDNTKNFETGKEYAFAADIVDKTDRQYGKVEMTYVSESISEEASEANVAAVIKEEKNEAIENLTYFIAYKYIIWANDYSSRRELKRLESIVAEFELSDEDDAKIDTAWALYNERMTKMSEREERKLESLEIREQREEKKREVVESLRATGNDSIADVAEYDINTNSRYFDLELDSYARKLETNAATQTTRPEISKLATELEERGVKCTFLRYEYWNNILHANQVPVCHMCYANGNGSPLIIKTNYAVPEVLKALHAWESWGRDKQMAYLTVGEILQRLDDEAFFLKEKARGVWEDYKSLDDLNGWYEHHENK